MPYKRSGSPNYYVEIRPDGYPHKIGPRSTGHTSKRKARQVEATLRELAASGRHDALDAVRRGELSPSEVHGAKAAGRLDSLLNGRERRLKDVTETFIEDHHDRRVEDGLRRMLDVAPDGAPVSWIRDPENVRKVIRQYEDQGLAPSTEHREISGVRQLIRRVFGETARQDVFSRVNLRPVPDKRTRYLEADEIERVRKVAGQWWKVIALYLATGMRRGELVNLQRRDVNLEAGIVTVEAGKSDRAARDIPIDGEALDLLRRWCESQKLASSDPLFPGLHYNYIGDAWRAIREEADVEGATIHSLRHTYAVHAARAGTPMVTLCRRMGHTDISTTMRYAKYRPQGRAGHYSAQLDAMGLSEENSNTDSHTAGDGSWRPASGPGQ